MSRPPRVDLHAHTNASDGEHSPEELIQIARRYGVTVLGICDHDTVNGLERARAAAARVGDIEIIPGVEFSTDWRKREVHVLAYWVDPHDPATLALADKFREGRYGRAQKILSILETLGVPVSFARVQEIAGDAAIGRPHIAAALVEAGHVAAYQDAFDLYLASGKPAYVEYQSASPAEAVTAIREIGAVPVLAHPRDIVELVPELVQAGLMGLECYYAEYDEHTQRELVALTKQYGLIRTGGSDFHGLSRSGHMGALGQVEVPIEVVAQLKRAKEKIQGR